MSIVRAFGRTIRSMIMIIVKLMAFAVACLAFIGYLMSRSI